MYIKVKDEFINFDNVISFFTKYKLFIYFKIVGYNSLEIYEYETEIERDEEYNKICSCLGLK